MTNNIQKNGCVSIVYFGDSITEGQYVDPQLRWSNLVSQSLKKQYSDSVEIIGYNRGISGHTTVQGMLRFPQDVQQNTPDILTLQFGFNDCNHWDSDKGYPRVSRSTFKSIIEEMIDRARHFGTEHIILSNNHKSLKSNILPGNTTLEQERAIYNDIIKDIASEQEVTFCDIDAWFNQVDNASYEDYLLPEPDLLHLSELGHQHYANAIKPYLQCAIEDIIATMEHYDKAG